MPCPVPVAGNQDRGDVLLEVGDPVGAIVQPGEQSRLDQTVEVIRQARADIVGLQETAGNAAGGPRPDRAAEIAKRLGWNYLDQGGRTGIISRFPLARN